MTGQKALKGTGIIKFVLREKRQEFHHVEPWIELGKAFFVSRSETAAEGEGYLLTYAYNAKTGLSELLVLDAQNISAKPIARVKFAFRIPHGFHYEWVPA